MYSFVSRYGLWAVEPSPAGRISIAAGSAATNIIIPKNHHARKSRPLRRAMVAGTRPSTAAKASVSANSNQFPPCRKGQSLCREPSERKRPAVTSPLHSAVSTPYERSFACAVT